VGWLSASTSVEETIVEEEGQVMSCRSMNQFSQQHQLRAFTRTTTTTTMGLFNRKKATDSDTAGAESKKDKAGWRRPASA
jgi:hypothetical protein